MCTYRYKVPSRQKVMSSLSTVREDIQGKIKEELRSCKGIGLTHDGWTSVNTDSYNTTTIHYIDKDWNMKAAVLSTKKLVGSHTSEKIAETLQEVKQEWNLPDLVATSDNTANEVKAFALLGWLHFGCYGHKFNLVAKKALERVEISKLLGKGRHLVSFMHSSSSVTDILKEKQALLLPEELVGHKLIGDVCTRRNSSLAMLKRLVEQTPALMALVSDERVNKSAQTTIKNCLYTFEEASVAEKIITVLEPFQKATEIFHAENVPTICKVLPVVVKLGRALKENEDDPSTIKTLKGDMRSQLEKQTLTENVALIGCILNPYTKGFEFYPEMKPAAENLLRKVAGTVKVQVKGEQGEVSCEADASNQPQPLPALPSLDTNLLDSVPDQPSESRHDDSIEIARQPQENEEPVKKN